MNPIDKIKECINQKKSFVLQGGAGSGKTETLKTILEYVMNDLDNKRVVCITHTNFAVAEIQSRLEGGGDISTIHSFLNNLIKDYKLNIHSVIYELFKVPQFTRSIGDGGADYRKIEHENYKSIYKKYSSKLYTITKTLSSKVVGKKEYDLNPETYNLELNRKIQELNILIEGQILSKDYNSISYNETSFDDFDELSFGHDGLLYIAHLLFLKYPTLGKILQDKYDFIFVDEYQDTNEKIIDIFLKRLPVKDKTVVGLFGDSMQSIYEDGIGSVASYVGSDLIEIVKEDNYRCSEQVISLINQLRNDGLVQKVAFKAKGEGGELEEVHDRQGEVKMFYAVLDKKPNAFSSNEDKSFYTSQLNRLIKYAQERTPDAKILMLTNKSISQKAGFESLYNIFSKLYSDPKDHIDLVLAKLHFSELYDLCKNYSAKNYNAIYVSLQNAGFSLAKVEDKRILNEKIVDILNSTGSAFEVLNKAFHYKLIKPSESYHNYLAYKEKILNELIADTHYQEFKSDYLSGHNTLTRMRTVKPEIEEDTFKEREREIEKEEFFQKLFSDDIPFKEIFKYFEYVNEDTDYITMHKTKGAGLDNVLIVFEEYFWNAYRFEALFNNEDTDVKLRSLKLAYVACSRAKSNLYCVKLIKPEEENQLQSYFETSIKVDLSLL